jgi:CheY-specific phosphatase CheX
MNSVAEVAFASMRRHLVEAAVALFASYGLPIEPRPSEGGFGEGFSESDGKIVLGVIGYVGQQVRGALVLLTSRPAIQAWHAALGGLDKNDVCDTLGEFSNMLLGHLKGRLLAEGFPILLSTPTTASAGELRMPPAVTPSAAVTFDGGGWRLDVRLDATFDVGFALKDAAERTTTVMAGDVVFF